MNHAKSQKIKAILAAQRGKVVPKMRVVGQPKKDNAGPPPEFKGRVVDVRKAAAPGSGKIIIRGRQVSTEDGYVLTTDELRNRFSRNLDRLLGLLGFGRKDAAEQIGIPYKFMRRIVSAGISRTDDRSKKEMTRLAEFFALPNFEAFWEYDLAKRVLTTEEGRGFVEKFKPRLAAERERRLLEAKNALQDELTLLSQALGCEVSPTTLSGPYAAKVAEILDSPKASSFKQIIDDYHALIQPPHEGASKHMSKAVG